MKNLKDLFPKASSSFLQANPDAFPQPPAPTTLPPKQNDSSAILERSRSYMNATEHSFSIGLEVARRAGEIEDWKFEAIKLRISFRCFYTPDFFVEYPGIAFRKPLFIEVKGPFIRDDARVKFLAAQALHKWADFEMHQRSIAGWKRIL